MPAATQVARGEALLQYFNMSYAEIARKMPELAEAGYNSIWLPPPTKASGGLSVGYDLWDPFDLGSKDQRSTVRTRYGTEAELQHMMDVAHRFGMRVYFDNIMNHRAFDVPGFNENTSIFIYPGMVPEDFHLRVTEDGFYRKWDNTRDWQSAWQVLHLGLSDLIDIAHETPNANFGPNEGDTHPKYSFVRDYDRPEQYDRNENGEPVYFGWLLDWAAVQEGMPANPTYEQLRSKAQEFLDLHEAAYKEDVGAYLIRAVRWKMDRTKADGLRLDAVKHVPDYFYGQMSGENKDTSDAG
jgi:glycosidase